MEACATGKSGALTGEVRMPGELRARLGRNVGQLMCRAAVMMVSRITGQAIVATDVAGMERLDVRRTCDRVIAGR